MQTSKTRPAFLGAVNTLADAIRAADGVIFCTPEYNCHLGELVADLGGGET